jgi:hypothetical protein
MKQQQCPPSGDCFVKALCETLLLAMTALNKFHCFSENVLITQFNLHSIKTPFRTFVTAVNSNQTGGVWF